MQNKLYSFSNYIKTYYSITETSKGFEITKKQVNILTKKVKEVTYKTVSATYRAAERFMNKCRKISRTLTIIYSRAKEMAIEAKVDNCKAFFNAAKKYISDKLKEEEAFCKRFGSH